MSGNVKTIAAEWVRKAMKVVARVDLAVASLFSRFAFLSSLYYALLSRVFRREHQAVLSGRAAYFRQLRTRTRGLPLLRRNIHRLEKGLLMVPRRSLFAVDYIDETVDAFARCLSAEEEGNEPPVELRWARDVLREYFDVTDRAEKTEAARQRFGNLDGLSEDSAPRCIPNKYESDWESPVSIDALAELARHRHSVRWFLPKKVDRKIIDRAVAIAAEGPSACNRQPFHFHVIDEQPLLGQVSSIPMGTGGFAHNIPVFVVITGELNAFFHERDRHLIYIDASLAAMAFILAMEAQGLSTCVVNWPEIGKKEHALQKILRFEPATRPVLCIAAGYADPEGKVASSQKKELSQLRSYTAT